MSTVRAMTGKDWGRALGLDRPEVRQAIEEASEKLARWMATRPEQACWQRGAGPRCHAIEKQPGDGFGYLIAWQRFDDRKVVCV